MDNQTSRIKSKRVRTLDTSATNSDIRLATCNYEIKAVPLSTNVPYHIVGMVAIAIMPMLQLDQLGFVSRHGTRIRITDGTGREQVAVTADHCLKAYLLHTFQKRIDITAAEKFLATFRTQQAKQTCTDFIDVFMIKFEKSRARGHKGGKYLLFESSRSVKMRGFSFLSLYAF